jgi:hypothetical protein
MALRTRTNVTSGLFRNEFAIDAAFFMAASSPGCIERRTSSWPEVASAWQTLGEVEMHATVPHSNHPQDNLEANWNRIGRRSFIATIVSFKKCVGEGQQQDPTAYPKTSENRGQRHAAQGSRIGSWSCERSPQGSPHYGDILRFATVAKKSSKSAEASSLDRVRRFI